MGDARPSPARARTDLRRRGGARLRIAAAADLHARQGDEERIARLFDGVSASADALVLAGDLTDHGRAGEAEALVKGLRGVEVPVVAVLGNHDHEAGTPVDIMRILASAGFDVLDRRRPTTRIQGVGFAGVKGFGGGFGDRLVRGFGEDSLKAFVGASVVEAEALRAGLLALEEGPRVAVTHYAPVTDTIGREPPEIWAFLGTSRLAAAIDEGGASLAIHGHAHHGRPDGKTPGGVPVHNVSEPVLRAEGHPRGYVVLGL